jgi:cyclopropane fatty-acyl-phospholipid synthase-like methyltransferase
MTKDRVDLFDRWSETYDRSVLDECGVHAGYDDVLEAIVRAADARLGMRVLDLGIGTGNLAQRFVALGCAVWGIDFSPAMLALAEAKLPEAILVQADLRDDWPSELDGLYDRIVSSYVLHEFSLETKVRLLERLATRHLAEGGRVVVGDISFPSVQARVDAGADHWDEEEHYWAADETLAACAPVGLRFSYTQVSTCGGVYVFEPALGCGEGPNGH